MKIDRKKLNLVIPIVGPAVEVNVALNGGPPKMELREPVLAYVHSAPIGREVFDMFYLPLAKTFNKIFAGGLGVTAGPRVASMLLRDSAKELDLWEGQGGVETGLMPEIRRLTNVIAPSDRGWDVMPYDTARQTGIVDDDDASEVENAIAFFIVVSAILKKNEIAGAVSEAAALWGAETSLCNCTEFKDSLPTSKPGESSGAKETRSSIPH